MSIVRRVAILDESDANQLFFTMLFQGLPRDFEVFTTSDAHEIERRAAAGEIDLLVTAWHMRVVPGYVFIQRLRSRPRGRWLPCMVFSKRLDDAEIALSYELGVQDFLMMPFDRDQATRSVQELVTRVEGEAEVDAQLIEIEELIAAGSAGAAFKKLGMAEAHGVDFGLRGTLDRGEIYLQGRQFEKSLQVVEDALETGETNWELREMRGRLCSLLERHDEALPVLEERHAESPKNLTTLMNLTRAYLNADRDQDASESLRLVAQADASHPHLADEQARLAFKTGDYEEARRLLEGTQRGEAMARQFNHWAIRRVSAGELEKGIEIYQRALEVLRDRARLHVIYYNLALALKKNNDLPGAFAALCESYVCHPAFERAYSALAKVSQEIKKAGGTLDAELVQRVKVARQTYKEERAKNPR